MVEHDAIPSERSYTRAAGVKPAKNPWLSGQEAKATNARVSEVDSRTSKVESSTRVVDAQVQPTVGIFTPLLIVLGFILGNKKSPL